MDDRIGTHSPDCWSFGPRHYDCATRRVAELEAKLATAVKTFGVIAAASERSETMFGGKMSDVSRVFQNISRVARQALASIQERT